MAPTLSRGRHRLGCGMSLTCRTGGDGEPELGVRPFPDLHGVARADVTALAPVVAVGRQRGGSADNGVFAERELGDDRRRLLDRADHEGQTGRCLDCSDCEGPDVADVFDVDR